MPSGSLTFLDGETSKVVVVPVKSDRDLERDEGFLRDAEQSSGNAALGNSTVTGTVLNDDLNRLIFYNHSTGSIFGDGSGNPVNAIDPLKQALLSGETADTFHYTNYTLGLNGILLDGYGWTGVGVVASSSPLGTVSIPTVLYR